jgi:hypothetical protein
LAATSSFAIRDRDAAEALIDALLEFWLRRGECSVGEPRGAERHPLFGRDKQCQGAPDDHVSGTIGHTAHARTCDNQATARGPLSPGGTHSDLVVRAVGEVAAQRVAPG